VVVFLAFHIIAVLYHHIVRQDNILSQILLIIKV